jgi:hypothetical protein
LFTDDWSPFLLAILLLLLILHKTDQEQDQDREQEKSTSIRVIGSAGVERVEREQPTEGCPAGSRRLAQATIPY